MQRRSWTGSGVATEPSSDGICCGPRREPSHRFTAEARFGRLRASGCSRSTSIGRLSTLGRSADPPGIQSLVGILHENPNSLCLEVVEDRSGQNLPSQGTTGLGAKRPFISASRPIRSETGGGRCTPEGNRKPLRRCA
jgi:hypothetical protein